MTKNPSGLRLISKRPAYLALIMAIAILFYEINVIIASSLSIKTFFAQNGFLSTIPFFYSISLGFGQVITKSSFISLIITSILVGTLISLMIFKIKTQKTNLSKKSNTLGTIGLTLAILAPGCAACGLGIIALLGLGGIALNFLPFKGLEISLLAILILSFTIFKMSKDMKECDICKVDFKKNERGLLINGK